MLALSVPELWFIPSIQSADRETLVVVGGWISLCEGITLKPAGGLSGQFHTQQPSFHHMRQLSKFAWGWIRHQYSTHIQDSNQGAINVNGIYLAERTCSLLLNISFYKSGNSNNLLGNLKINLSLTLAVLQQIATQISGWCSHLLVNLSVHHFRPGWHSLTFADWIAMKCCTDIHGPWRINLNNDPMTLLSLPLCC